VHLELVDALRCPAGHEESHLVASIDRLVGRCIAEGSLGCPVCRRTFPIHDFAAWFAPAKPGAPLAPPAGHDPPADDHALARAAALLDARTPGARFLLCGERARLAPMLALAYDVHCVALNPAPGVDAGDGVSLLYTGDRAPLAGACAAGAALDDDVSARAALLASVIDAVRAGGRVVGPASVPPPPGLRVLAADATDWVAERPGPPAAPVPLRRASR
jgi:hypothetical protein